MAIEAFRKRVEKLELQQLGAGRMIIVFGQGQITDRHTATELAARGISVTPNDDLILFLNRYETRDGAEDGVTAISSVSVTPIMRKGR